LASATTTATRRMRFAAAPTWSKARSRSFCPTTTRCRATTCARRTRGRNPPRHAPNCAGAQHALQVLLEAQPAGAVADGLQLLRLEGQVHAALQQRPGPAGPRRLVHPRLSHGCGATRDSFVTRPLPSARFRQPGPASLRGVHRVRAASLLFAPGQRPSVRHLRSWGNH